MSGRVVVYGGKGALGSAVVKYFKSKNWWVGSIDLFSNEDADTCIALSKDATLQDQAKIVLSELNTTLGNEKVDAVINVAGGWAGGNSAHSAFLKNCELMWQQSVWSSLISAQVAVKFLKEGGVLSLPGAQPVLGGTPEMIGYGVAKAAVHHLTKSLALENSGLPKGVVCLAILPITLDTPSNRKWMSGSDFSTWTPLEYISELLFKWSSGKEQPESGSLIQLVTKDNKTELILS